CCITTMEDYYSRVRFQLRAFVHPNLSREPVMNSWKEVADKLYEMPDWGLQFKNNRPGELVLEAAGITAADFANQMQTIKKLYNYINHNIQWDDYYSIGLGREISAILKTKSGDSGELNKLMHAALLQAGIPSRPVLMSTRENGKHFEIYPFIDQFNHMAVLANVDGKDMWLDLGDKNLPSGLLRPEVLNSKGWIADELNPSWIDVKVPDSKSVYYVKGALDVNGNFTGDLEARFTGYHALTQREIAADKKENYGSDLLGYGTSLIGIPDIEKINEKETDLPFQLKGKIVDFPIATVSADKIYMLPIIANGLTNSPFKLEERTYPIEMNYAEEISMILDIVLPEGYKIESVPEPVRFVTEGNGIIISYNASHTPGKLNVNMKYTGKQLYFDPKEYAALKNIYSQRSQKFNEQIVLSKI
ncbi:MAG TPA: transglutaminase-like domain-containing protein, partial [Flavitalea sp.]|nr:transglutaminase-like domain-containing protein [Flavitalea sp.]